MIPWRIFVLVILMFWYATRPGAAQDSVFLEELTWTEVRDAIRAGKTTVIIPTGGTEQNGPHMILGKHNVRIKFTSGEIAKRLGNALVAPVMAYVPEGDIDPPASHMRFPGTITLPAEHFAKVVEFAARSLKAHGFLDIALIGDSGGNQASLKAVAELLNQEWASSPARVHHLNTYYDDESAFRAWLIAQGENVEDTHAGIIDTSLQLAVDTSGVRRSRLAPGRTGDGTGVNGDPTRASVEYGKKGLELAIERAVRQFQDLRESSRRR
jgi:creatinine amidohydrolase/Fe(II)-dependent formamide hydrolase-like protein